MKRRRRSKPAGYWGRRVDALIRACGWSREEWCHHFGYGEKAVRRVRYGGHPTVRFVLRLRRLEQLFAIELEALAKGLIVARGGVRYDWRDPASFGRPAELQDIGAAPTGDYDKAGGFAKRSVKLIKL